MTMPTRPAPAPPRLKGHNAAINANVTLQQLHLVQQHQQQQQQQLEQRSQRYNVTVPKLTIKLPPSSIKEEVTLIHNDNIENNVVNTDGMNENDSLNQQVFPKTRYTPTTDWNDTPFKNFVNDKIYKKNSNGLYRIHKKIPPPRPPPPQCNNSSGGGVYKKITTPLATIQQSTNVLNNLFHRKKTTTISRPVAPNSTASRIYNSATYGGSTRNEIKSIQLQQHNSNTNRQQLQQNNTTFTTNWDLAWNTSTNASIVQAKEPQLISFDSPPSSPTFTQKSNSDCLSVDSFSSDSNFSSPNYGSASQPESGFEDDFNNTIRSRTATTSPRDPWDTIETLTTQSTHTSAAGAATEAHCGSIGTGHVRNLNIINARIQNSDDNPLCNGKNLLPPAPSLNIPTIIKPKISQKPKAPKPPPAANNQQQTTIMGHININDTNLDTKWPSSSLSVSSSISKPILSNVANPGISILDVITGKIDALELGSHNINDAANSLTTIEPYGISVYPFDSNEDGDLCFRENEKIYLLEQINADWLRGRTRVGCEGIFPANYIDIKVPLANNTKLYHNNVLVSNSISNNAQMSNSILQGKCLYNFPAEVDGDLDLKENDVVTILYRINADWLYGELNGRQGQFPANFLQNIPSNIPTL